MADLKLEAGKYYRDIDGDRAYVVGKNPFSGQWLVVWKPEDERQVGLFECDGYSEEHVSLIEEWREPVEAWAVIGRNKGGKLSLHFEKESAERCASTISCRIVHLVEKEGA